MAAELFCSVKPAVFMYALGMTQHTVGVENIRCFTVLQLLRGNIGVPGGGIDAMRGQPNVQTSTDYGIMFQYFPGYLPWPTEKTNTLAKWTPFRMVGEGVGRIFAASYKDEENGETRDSSSTPVDGPIPELYEPVESPTNNALHMNPNAQFSPCVIYPRMPDLQKIGTKSEFPYVLCSSSICEHWCSVTITRHITWLNGAWAD